jgi:two-component sensor histidine kinase
MGLGSEAVEAEAVTSWRPRARFERMARAVKALSGARTHDAIVEIVRRAAREITGALGVAIVLREGDQCHYIAEDSAVPLWSGQRFPLTACISGWAMLNRRYAAITDIYQDPRIPHAAYRPTGIHSLVMAPVGDGEPIGALGAYWAEVREPSEEEISALMALASCMATALENIGLLESLTAEAAHKQLLINELNHRVKNTLAIVQSLAAQTLRGDRAFADARADFDARLMALSGAHILMTEGEWRPVGVNELIDRTLSPFVQGEDLGRFDIAGPELSLAPRSAVAFALAIHELCTNASKYGALSAPEGRVGVRWGLADGRMHFTWIESGGPPVRPPSARGFGSRLLERGLSEELKGKVVLDFPPEGLVCRMDLAAPVPQDEPLFPLPAE